jgi:hypothetical protein
MKKRRGGHRLLGRLLAHELTEDELSLTAAGLSTTSRCAARALAYGEDYTSTRDPVTGEEID